jgi:hypothetical protein
MAATLRRWFDVHEDEVAGILVAALTLFLINGAGVVLNNYTETAFLKRFGIHYLPAVSVVNALVTFVVMGFFGTWMARVPGTKLLRRMLLFCAATGGLLRVGVPVGTAYLYPLLYILKTQFDLLLAFLFWNLANDLFSTLQSKRVFPLLAAGSIVGGIAGSFGTPWLASLGSNDNLLWVYTTLTLAAAALVGRLDVRGLTDPAADAPRSKPGWELPVFAEIRNALNVLRSSSLARLLVLLTLLPNIVAPILNFQFSFAVDMAYGSESSLLGFYSVFRGVQNVLALFIALYAGRLVKRIGIPSSLLFHPVNYVLVFAGFLFRFDIVTAVYAGLSVGVIRRAVQTPSRKALFGLFSARERALLLPFLRGAVIRVGLLLGSLFVLVCQSGYFAVCRIPLHPENLSPFGLLFAGIWVLGTLQLRRRYPAVLLEVLGGPLQGASPAAAAGASHTLAAELAPSADRRLRDAWHRVSAAAALRSVYGRRIAPEGTESRLLDSAYGEALGLLDHLVLSDPDGRFRAVRAAYHSGDPRDRANALEALDCFLDRHLRPLVRLLEEREPARLIAALPRRYHTFRGKPGAAAVLASSLAGRSEPVAVSG